MSKIMELADAYAAERQRTNIYSNACTEARAALQAEVAKLEAEVFDVTNMYNRCVEDVHALREKLAEVEKERYNYQEALWKACGDDEVHVNAYLEATK